MLKLSTNNDFILGVVGWIDLLSDQLSSRLEHYSQWPKIRGFRHLVQDEPDDDFLLREDVIHGLSQFRAFDLTYDLLITPRQLDAARQLTHILLDQKLVIDHLAKPMIDGAGFDRWKRAIKSMAENPRVYCKLSGLVTEAHWQDWSYDQFVPFLDVVMEAFGPGRLMYGSDWPVCLLAADYDSVMGIVRQTLAELPVEQQSMIWGRNALDFYGIVLGKEQAVE